jgi:hypothetical protein
VKPYEVEENLHNYGLRNLYSPLKIIRMNKSRTMMRTEHAAILEKQKAYNILVRIRTSEEVLVKMVMK